MNISRAIEISAVAIALACAVGCSGNSGGQGTASAPAGSNAAPATIANPTDFPLPADDKILDAKPFNQVVSSSQSSGTALAQGAGNYTGHSVIAQSSGSLADAKAWLVTVEKSPPSGYTYVPTAEHPTAVATAAKYGVTYAVFRNGAKGAVIVVIDPKLAHDKLGVILTAANNYQMLPAQVRSSIDARVKAKTGMSVTEALDPSAPVGMTLQALKTVNGSDNPAIVELDATKQ